MTILPCTLSLFYYYHHRLVSVGNRFANEFYANISSDRDLGSCFNVGCGATILKELPCIYKAIKDGSLDEHLLKCGLGNVT